MKRTHLIAILVGLAVIVNASTDAKARYNPGMNVYPGVATPMPPGSMQPIAASPMMAMPMPGRMSVPTAGGFDRPHVGVNVYPSVPSATPHPDGQNPYQYVRSNPANRIDPSGLVSFTEGCSEAQKTELAQLTTKAHKDIKNIISSVENELVTGGYSWLMDHKLIHALSVLHCADGKLDSLGAKCECPGESRICERTIAWANWVFARRIHICPGFWEKSYTPIERESTLVHEATHACGTLDGPREQLVDNFWVGWQDNAETYEWWIEHGFSLP